MNDQQEYLMKLQVLEHEAGQLGEQAKVIDKQVGELKALDLSLDALEKSGEEDIYSELGKGIFVKSKIKKSDLLIEVGNKIYVPKKFEDVKLVISDQITKLDKIKGEIAKKIEEINSELNKVIESSKDVGAHKGVPSPRDDSGEPSAEGKKSKKKSK